MELTPQQKTAMGRIKQFLVNGSHVFILSGYAGTGKTTMIREMVRLISPKRPVSQITPVYQRQEDSKANPWEKTVVLVAPTGRAARVLKEKTGRGASTIHHAIYGSGGIAVKNDDKDLAETEVKIFYGLGQAEGNSVIIVDEASMVCSRTSTHELFQFGTDNLMNDLLDFARLREGGKIIFVGDPAQLPPVGESTSNALSAAFFEAQGLQVMTAELTDVVRQAADSTILINSMHIRRLLDGARRNRLVFEEKKDEVVNLRPQDFLSNYYDAVERDGASNTILITYSNRAAANYNREIRKKLFGRSDEPLRVGDSLMVVYNNYNLELMNGELTTVRRAGKIIEQPVPVYVTENGNRVKKIIKLRFQDVCVIDGNGEERSWFLMLDLLENDRPSLSIDEVRALFINFCIRHQGLRRGSPEFVEALKNDSFYNALRVKYGYAITGHKSQGGEWRNVFVDYAGRTGLNDDSLRWAYTATTRARKTLYFTNLPHITPFAKFRIDPIQACSKLNPEFRALGSVMLSPYHADSADPVLHAKCRCIMNNIDRDGYVIECVESKPYLEIYYIRTPQTTVRYDIRYKQGGLFSKAVTQNPIEEREIIEKWLNDESDMPTAMSYTPSDDLHEQLFNTIRSAADELTIPIMNVVEHPEDYSTLFYFRTTSSYSYLKVYNDNRGFVTYAKPMSLLGAADSELSVLIDRIQLHFE